ncbi:MAG: hypothetical protein Q8P89_01820 [bacterium]|nr:hypothetical protein [bacterium]
MIISASKSVKNISPGLWQDRLSLQSTILAFFLTIASFSLLAFFVLRLPPQVPLFYSQPWGEDQLVPPQLVFLLPASALMIIIINLLMARLFAFLGEKLIIRTLSLTTLAYASLSLFAVINVIRVSL